MAKREGKHPAKTLTLEPDAQHVAGISDAHADVWWLRHLASAVPDHAVDKALRRFRTPDAVRAPDARAREHPAPRERTAMRRLRAPSALPPRRPAVRVAGR